MSEKIKGITLTVGGDTAGLRKELTKVNKESASVQKELREVENALKLDPKNVELLAQKQKLLADAIGTTEYKLKELKEAQEKADKAIGEGAEISQKQYRLLQREISNTEAKLKGLKEQSEKTNDTIADVEKPKKGLESLKTATGPVAKGIGAVTAAGTALAAALSEIEEETREYRSDLSKLKTNAEAAGVSFEKIKGQLNSVVAITDEADSSIEALSNLLMTDISEGGLEKIIKELSGAVIAFPDTLKIESLADGLQETLATGNAVGQFGELLERCGINLEEFNSGLEKSKQLGQEEQYILETLSQTGMADINESYVQTNESLIKIKQSQQEWNDTMARVGELVAPIKAEFISFGAEFLNSLIGMNDETAIFIDSINKENEAFWAAKEAQEAKLESDIAEIDYTIRLYDELENLVDANGMVLESNKNRVSYILNELSEATGIELELTGNQIKNYGDLSASIEEMLAKKRAGIILASQEEAYKKAVSEIGDKQIEQSELYMQILEKEMEVKEANAALTEYSTNQEKLSVLSLQNELTNMRDTYNENDKVINEYYSNISDYETNYKRLMSGNAEEISQINNTVAESFKVTGEATEEELKKQVALTAFEYAEIQRKVDEGVKGVTHTMADEALVQYSNAVAEYQKIGKAIPDGMQVGIEAGKPTLQSKVTGFIAQVKSWFTGKDGFDTHSPSRWSGKLGKNIDEGLANEIFNNINLVQTSFRELFTAVEAEHEALTKEEEKYNSELERIRAAGTEKANESYLENLKMLAEEAKERRKLIRDTYEGMVEGVQKSIDTLKKDMESYEKDLSKVDLTTTKEETMFIFNDEEIKQSVTRLADLSGIRKGLEQFRDNIIELREIGIDESMLDEIKELGGEKGGLFAQALLDASPEERETFINDFKAIGELSGQATAELFKDELEGASGDIKTLFEELNPDFLKIGEDWGTVLGDGIMLKLNNTLQNLKNIVGSIDFNYGSGSGVYGPTLSGKQTTVNYKTEINQFLTATPDGAYEISEQTRRIMENLTNQAVLS